MNTENKINIKKLRLWNRLKLRGRLLTLMLTVALAAVLICALSFGVSYYRMLTISQEHARVLSHNVHHMVEMAFYQQETYIRKVYAVSQANLLDTRLAELKAQNKSPDWNALVKEAYDLINNIEWSGAGTLDFENAMFFILTDGQLYVLGTDTQTLTDTADKLFRSPHSNDEKSFIEMLQEYNTMMSCIRGDDGVLLTWYHFGDGENRVGMLVPNTDALRMSEGLRELMDVETSLALEKISSTARQSVLGLLLAILVLLILLPLASRRFALVVVNPVEREQERQRDLLRVAEEKKAMLERLDRLKTDFLGTVSHEISKPLTAISASSADTVELVKETPVNMYEIIENHQRIEKKVMLIDRIVMDLMDTVAIESGRLPLSRQLLNLSAFLESVCDTVFMQVNINGNSKVYDFEPDLPSVWADPIRLEQVMMNLISNSVRHTKNGVIAIKLMRTEKGQTVCVTDNGEGINPEIADVVLKQYISSKGDYWRHGYGLYICRQIVLSHGGEIWIESEKGRGTSVFFTLTEADYE